MAAHDSQYPGEDKSKTIRVDSTGISTNWRNFIIAVTTVIATFTGYTGLRFVTCDEMDEAIGKAKAEQSRDLTSVKKEVEAQGKQLVGITVTVGQMQTVQHQDIAVREARRVVSESIKCRRGDQDCWQRFGSEMERIRRINMRRLAVPKERGGPLEPCADLNCQ